jgi:hypothetical protein
MADDDDPFAPSAAQQRPGSDVGSSKGGTPTDDSGGVGGLAGALGGAAALLTAVRFGLGIGEDMILRAADRLGDLDIPVASTCIDSVSYNIKSGDMEVTFQDGSVYYYPQTPMITFLQFINAPSKGAFYNKYLRGRDSIDYMGKKKGWKMPLK